MATGQFRNVKNEKEISSGGQRRRVVKNGLEMLLDTSMNVARKVK